MVSTPCVSSLECSASSSTSPKFIFFTETKCDSNHVKGHEGLLSQSRNVLLLGFRRPRSTHWAMIWAQLWTVKKCRRMAAYPGRRVVVLNTMRTQRYVESSQWNARQNLSRSVPMLLWHVVILTNWQLFEERHVRLSGCNGASCLPSADAWVRWVSKKALKSNCGFTIERTPACFLGHNYSILHTIYR